MIRSIRRKLSGFTLIELLVVIAIIGLLAALLFPAIQGALLKAKATAAGTKMGVRGLTGVIYSSGLDKIVANLADDFPQATGPTNVFATSTLFFNSIFTQPSVTQVMTVAAISLPGQKVPATTLPITDLQNMWNVVTGLGTDSDPNTPFMFTKNITWATLNVEPTITLLADGLDKPILSDKLAIIVGAQGAVRIVDLKPSMINNAVLLGGAVYNNGVIVP